MAIHAPAEPTVGTDTVEMRAGDTKSDTPVLTETGERAPTFQELMAGGTVVTEHARARGEALRAVFNLH